MKNAISRIALLAAAFAVFRLDAAYLVKVTNGDLAAAETYSASQLPGESDEVEIDGTWGGTYTLSRDMSIGSMRLDAGNVTFDFREGNHILTLTAPISPHGSDTLFRYTEFPANKNWTKLCGGIWECRGENFDIVNLGFGGPYTFILTNGCHLSNVDRSYLFRRISNSRIYICDESKITAKELDYGNGFIGTNDIIEVSGGSDITLTGDFAGQSSSEACCSNWLVVRDENTKLSAKFLYLGKNGYGGFGVKVFDNARLDVNYPTFSAGAENCAIEIIDGAQLHSYCFDWYGSRCYTLVSNATLNIQWGRFSLGGKDNQGNIGHHNRLTIAGSSAQLLNPEGTSDFMGANSHDNVFELTAGAKFALNRSMKLATSTNNIIRLSGEDTELSMAGHEASSSRYLFEFGWTNAVGNTLEVLDGAELSANGLWVYGKSSEIIVSNATLSVGGYYVSGDYGIWLGRGENASGCSLTVKGTVPKIKAIVPDPDVELFHRMIIAADSVLRYEIPKEGYAPGHIPVELYGLYPVNSNCRLEVECSEWAAVKGLPASELTLFRGKDVTDLEKLASRACETLPGNVKLFIRSGGDGHDIVLRRRGSRENTIILR